LEKFDDVFVDKIKRTRVHVCRIVPTVSSFVNEVGTEADIGCVLDSTRRVSPSSPTAGPDRQRRFAKMRLWLSPEAAGDWGIA
jgi:hypothetical protein